MAKSLCLTVYCGDILFCERSVFIQATTELYHWNQYDEEITKRCGSSVRPFVTLTKKPTLPSLLTVEK